MVDLSFGPHNISKLMALDRQKKKSCLCRVQIHAYDSWIQGSHFSCDTKFHVFSRLFPGKRNEIQYQFGFESVFVLIMMIWQRSKSELFL